ncbi:unnamed protein product [Parascedosporium putredinis]|uniref:Aminoacyl-transfer RNA synthetases class-II family profile domain-containing protein n=1 Tax=Parascedosporium putredinis TaxID=1442378 RepID=A0A9P1H7X4_9PEZI|nr:unnamed protein product [Parascedosporium putredinis]CAI8000279.1 unnamed protein product [Parascedosporium putredinis]
MYVSQLEFAACRLTIVARKYRDELRPRHGLLRSREFTMKDLYTFDIDIPSALQTYRRVGESYSHFFNQLSLPFIVAEASCGDMGGSMSHEYHIPSRLGEDTVVSCQQCGYAANEEVAALEGSVGIQPNISGPPRNPRVAVWRGVTKRRDTLVNVWYNSDRNAHSPINIHAVKALVPDLDPTIEDAAPIWDELLGKTNRIKSSTQPLNLVNLLDFRVAHLENEITNKPASLPAMFPPGSFVTEGVSQIFISKSALGRPLNLARVQNGDACPRCETGTVTVTRTLELGHTFHLGTRYSDPLAARVTIPQNKSGSHVPTSLAIQMGCFGIGITRIMGAIAEELSDEKGLIWPLRIAPYQVIIVPDFDLVQEAGDVYDTITTMSLGSSMSSLRHVDAIIDDRPQSMPWKLKDADITGYPILIIMGPFIERVGLSSEPTAPYSQPDAANETHEETCSNRATLLHQRKDGYHLDNVIPKWRSCQSRQPKSPATFPGEEAD